MLRGSGALLASIGTGGNSFAQDAKAPFVAWLASSSASDASFDAFRGGLRDLGYVEGRSIRIDAHRGHDNEELRTRARTLVREQVSVIVANGRGATRAAQEASASIPIVMAPVDDPYEFVASLSHPSGNITGLALQQTDIDAKQLEILKEIVPSLSRLAIFYFYGETYYSLESTAHALGIEALWIETKRGQEVEKAFAQATDKKANGILIVDASAHGTRCEDIAALALERLIPLAASWRGASTPGMLVSYAADESDLQHRAASYVARLLKGSKPGELPIEQATKFELFVNLRTARALGVTMPPSVQLRANTVIE